MFWLFAMATTAGVILGTPLVFQAMLDTSTDDMAEQTPTTTGRSSLAAFAAAALTAGGLGGLLALAFGPTDLIASVVALCLGLAGGAIHPELLTSLRQR